MLAEIVFSKRAGALSSVKSWLVAILAGIGAMICVGVLALTSGAIHTPYWKIPFITSIALVMGAPATEAARPQALIGGHVLCALCGYVVLWGLGSSPVLAAFGVGLAVLVMLRLKLLHPPAAVSPFLIVNEHLGFQFLWQIILPGSVGLALFAYAWGMMSRYLTQRASEASVLDGLIKALHARLKRAQ